MFLHRHKDIGGRTELVCFLISKLLVLNLNKLSGFLELVNRDGLQKPLLVWEESFHYFCLTLSVSLVVEEIQSSITDCKTLDTTSNKSQLPLGPVLQICQGM